MTDTSDDAPKILFFPPYLFFGAVVLAAALEWLVPLGVLPHRFSPLPIVIGALLLAVAAWLELSANRRFSKAETNVNPRRPALRVVRGGAYRFTRNPMYLGMLLIVLGLSLVFSLDWGIAILPLLWAALHWGVVLREEAYLTEKFGDDYKALLKATRRWL